MRTNQLTINVKKEFGRYIRFLDNWNGYKVYSVMFPPNMRCGRILIKENEEESFVMNPEEKRGFDKYIIAKHKSLSH